MKPITINQELLLLTGTSFSKRQLCEKDQACNEITNPSEQLQKACWSGMLFEMLPGLVEPGPAKAFVWEVYPAETFIRVQLGTTPRVAKKETSIDPHALLSVKIFN